MHRKRTIIIFATLLLIGASVVAALPLMIEWQGKRNTEYSSKYSNERFDQIQVGMPAEAVVTLVGEPISRSTQKDYPVWALREISVRERLGKDSKFDMEVWSYSSPRNPRQDYELIHVAFGPSKEVIDKERWVTD